jgi:hypothetical protein
LIEVGQESGVGYLYLTCGMAWYRHSIAEIWSLDRRALPIGLLQRRVVELELIGGGRLRLQSLRKMIKVKAVSTHDIQSKDFVHPQSLRSNLFASMSFYN